MPDELSRQILIPIIFLTMTAMTAYAKKTRKEVPVKNKDIAKDKIIWIFLAVIVAIPIILLMITELFDVSILDETGDISNWTTLIVELGIGTTIGFAIFVYSNYLQKESGEDLRTVKDISNKLDCIVTEVKKTTDEQKKIMEIENKKKEFRKDAAYEKLSMFFNGFLSDVFPVYYNETVENWQNDKEAFREYLKPLKTRFDDLKSFVYANSDIISPEIFRKLDIVWIFSNQLFFDFSFLSILQSSIWQEKMCRLKEGINQVYKMMHEDTITKKSPV